MKFVPFTIHIRVVPIRGKRFEYLKDLAKLSALAYDAISSISGVNVATPGGGQNPQLGDINRRGGFGSFAQGTAAKPQIGNSPAQLMLTGFYESSNNNTQAYAEHKRISGGEWYSGSGATAHVTMPSTAIGTEVKALKTAVEAALAANLPAGVEYRVFRLDYYGVVYGDKGFTFPQ